MSESRGLEQPRPILSGACQLAGLTSPALTGEKKVLMERYSDLFEWVRMALSKERSKT
jgi:hypothetical protein